MPRRGGGRRGHRTRARVHHNHHRSRFGGIHHTRHRHHFIGGRSRWTFGFRRQIWNSSGGFWRSLFYSNPRRSAVSTVSVTGTSTTATERLEPSAVRGMIFIIFGTFQLILGCVMATILLLWGLLIFGIINIIMGVMFIGLGLFSCLCCQMRPPGEDDASSIASDVGSNFGSTASQMMGSQMMGSQVMSGQATGGQVGMYPQGGTAGVAMATAVTSPPATVNYTTELPPGPPPPGGVAQYGGGSGHQGYNSFSGTGLPGQITSNPQYSDLPPSYESVTNQKNLYNR